MNITATGSNLYSADPPTPYSAAAQLLIPTGGRDPREGPVVHLGHRAGYPGRKAQDAGSPEGFRFHDLRHYFASLLIASALDVKTVQHRLRHGSATTTLNTCSHLWPDRDEQTRAAVGADLRAASSAEDQRR